MKPVIGRGVWGDGTTYDTLDEVRLLEGEQVYVKWPNGDVTQQTIGVEKRCLSLDDDYVAYIYVATRDLVHKLYLRGTDLLLQRLPNASSN